MGGECAPLPVPWPGADADGSGPGQTLFFSGNLGRPPQLHFLMDGGEKRLHNKKPSKDVPVLCIPWLS